MKLLACLRYGPMGTRSRRLREYQRKFSRKANSRILCFYQIIVSQPFKVRNKLYQLIVMIRNNKIRKLQQQVTLSWDTDTQRKEENGAVHVASEKKNLINRN